MLALFAMLFAAGCGPDGGPTLSAPEAFAKAQAGEITLIDIRTPREWRQTGVGAGAITIDMTKKTFVTETLDAVNGDKDAPIAIICRAGNRTTYIPEGVAGDGLQPCLQRQGRDVRQRSRPRLGKAWFASGQRQTC
jgi:hypothetical protein